MTEVVTGILFAYDLDSTGKDSGTVQKEHEDFKDALCGPTSAAVMKVRRMPETTVVLSGDSLSPNAIGAKVAEAAEKANCTVTRYAFSIGGKITIGP